MCVCVCGRRMHARTDGQRMDGFVDLNACMCLRACVHACDSACVRVTLCARMD